MFQTFTEKILNNLQYCATEKKHSQLHDEEQEVELEVEQEEEKEPESLRNSPVLPHT